MTPSRSRYNFWIDDELREGLRAVRERDGILESEQIRRAIRAWLTAKKVSVGLSSAERRALFERFQSLDSDAREAAKSANLTTVTIPGGIYKPLDNKRLALLTNDEFEELTRIAGRVNHPMSFLMNAWRAAKRLNVAGRIKKTL